MIQSTETELKDKDGNQVTIFNTLFPGSMGVELFSRVFLLAVPVMLPAMDTDDKKDIDFSKLASAIGTSFSDKKIVALVLDLVKLTDVFVRDNGIEEAKGRQNLGKKSNFDTVIAGNYALLIQIIKYVLEVNFKDFFGENGIKDLMTMIPGIVKR